MDGEFFGSTLDFEYNIGDKLYDFAIMEYNEFDKLKILYTELINIVCSNKECNGMDKKVNFLFEMFHKVQECLNFSPYTHFYTQTLIDIIIKTYNSGVFRSDLLFKNNIGVYIDNNELHCTIAVKPVKCLEFIVLNFIVTNQTANVEEET